MDTYDIGTSTIFSNYSDDVNNQHAGFLTCYGDLLRAIAECHGEKLDMSRIFVELFSYIDHHFSAEEHIMRITNYPDYEKHKMEHYCFSDSLDELSCRFEQGVAKLEELVNLLKRWKNEHIFGSDQILEHYSLHHRKARKRTLASLSSCDVL